LPYLLPFFIRPNFEHTHTYMRMIAIQFLSNKNIISTQDWARQFHFALWADHSSFSHVRSLHLRRLSPPDALPPPLNAGTDSPLVSR
jgi:hypothetical protein